MKPIHLWLLATFLMLSNVLFAQRANPNGRGFSLSAQAGYDFPAFNLPYQQLKHRGGRYLGFNADYFFGRSLGLRATYANLRTVPNASLPDSIYFGGTPVATTTQTSPLLRQYLGLGPIIRSNFNGSRWSVNLAPTLGRAWLRGGDTYVSASNAPQVVNTGYATGAWSTRADLGLNFAISDQLSVGLGAYYLRHFRVHPDNVLDLGPGGILTVAHGENIYDSSVNPYTLTSDPPMVVHLDTEQPPCKDLSSFGVTLSIGYRFGGAAAGAKEEQEAGCQTCPPNDGRKLLVTVRDGPTGQPLPNADVILKDLADQPLATGTTNTFGVVEFPDLSPGTYVVAGQLYEVATTTAPVAETEFSHGAIIRKDLFYEDLRFVLKGVAVNKADRAPEANVVARLTAIPGGSVRQDNTDPSGAFHFQLDGGTEYEVVGSKRNRLSDIERVSTVGLQRSTTLFVELELGVDDFDCGQGTVLDVKYDLGSYALLPAARFELDRLVRYLNDHPNDRVELGSHTDSQGSNQFNQRLSERRAQAAVNYIVGKGISPGRIIAHGYGESRLLNGCADDVPCSDEQHRVNRRTEAKLLCN